jgi:hypothetical protein
MKFLLEVKEREGIAEAVKETKILNSDGIATEGSAGCRLQVVHVFTSRI